MHLKYTRDILILFFDSRCFTIHIFKELVLQPGHIMNSEIDSKLFRRMIIHHNDHRHYRLYTEGNCEGN
jgi:hypothetical protein